MRRSRVPTRRRRATTSAILTLAMAGSMVGGAGRASARPTQQESKQESQDHVNPRAAREVRVTPRIGSPGTHVTLTVDSMPSLTPVQLALGATRSGFEALALALTTIDGDLEGSVVVPQWARRDQTHRFIVFNLYFSTVLAESAIFHVTDGEGRVVREGEVGRVGEACLMLRGDDGERYRLTGETARLQVGEWLRLEGVLSVAPDGCGEDLSLEIHIATTR